VSGLSQSSCLRSISSWYFGIQLYFVTRLQFLPFKIFLPHTMPSLLEWNICNTSYLYIVDIVICLVVSASMLRYALLCRDLMENTSGIGWKLNCCIHCWQL